MASFRKTGDKWRAEICANGVRKSKRFTSKLRARAWAEQQEQLYREGVTQTDKTLADAMDRYAREVSPTHKGRRWEDIRLNRLKSATVANYLIGDVAAKDIASWRDTRLSEVSPGTVRREMGLLRSVFDVARREWGWIIKNPMDDVRKPPSPQSRDRRITADEEKRLTVALPGEHRAIFLLALETGMRLGEICGITPRDVHGKYVTLRNTKNGTTRHVPLSTTARKLLASVGNEFRSKPSSASATFYKVRVGLGIKDLRFHDTRHEATTRLSEKLNVMQLAKMLGMKDTRTLMIYYEASPEDIADKLD